LLFWSVIYAVTQFDIPQEAQRRLLRGFGFSPDPSSSADNGYIQFMQAAEHCRHDSVGILRQLAGRFRLSF